MDRTTTQCVRISNQIKSNLFAIDKVHNKQFIKITFHLAGQTGDSFALMSAHILFVCGLASIEKQSYSKR